MVNALELISEPIGLFRDLSCLSLIDCDTISVGSRALAFIEGYLLSLTGFEVLSSI